MQKIAQSQPVEERIAFDVMTVLKNNLAKKFADRHFVEVRGYASRVEVTVPLKFLRQWGFRNLKPLALAIASWEGTNLKFEALVLEVRNERLEPARVQPPKFTLAPEDVATLRGQVAIERVVQKVKGVNMVLKALGLSDPILQEFLLKGVSDTVRRQEDQAAYLPAFEQFVATRPEVLPDNATPAQEAKAFQRFQETQITPAPVKSVDYDRVLLLAKESMANLLATLTSKSPYIASLAQGGKVALRQIDRANGSTFTIQMDKSALPKGYGFAQAGERDLAYLFLERSSQGDVHAYFGAPFYTLKGKKFVLSESGEVQSDAIPVDSLIAYNDVASFLTQRAPAAILKALTMSAPEWQALFRTPESAKPAKVEQKAKPLIKVKKPKDPLSTILDTNVRNATQGLDAFLSKEPLAKATLAKTALSLDPEKLAEQLVSMTAGYLLPTKKGKTSFRVESSVGGTGRVDLVLRYASSQGDVVERRLIVTPEGKMIMVNDFFLLKEKGTGLGTQMLYEQAKNAFELGVSELACEAARGDKDTYNGYYTWPRLGYDGYIPATSRARIARHIGEGLLPQHVASYRYVRELIQDPQTRDWWKENGVSFDATFEPKDLPILEAYLEQRAMKKKATLEDETLILGDDTPEPKREEVDLDQEGENILDNLWDALYLEHVVEEEDRRPVRDRR